MKSVDLAGRSLSHAQDALRLAHVIVQYDNQTVLQDLSLSVHQGEFLTLVGPSGCGKTTLLKVIAGVVQANGGEIEIDGQTVAHLSAHERAIGCVAAQADLLLDRDVAGNIAYALRMHGLADADIAASVDNAMALTKLTGLGKYMPDALSNEQQQRVALARALVTAPKVLLLDDAFSGLDKAERRVIHAELREIRHKLGLTVVGVTHDQSDALNLSDRIAVMAHGTIRQIGRPDDLYRCPMDRFAASFLGDVNILPAHFHGEDATHIHLRMGAGLIGIERDRLVGGRHDGGRMDIYVRPEHLRFAPLNAQAVLSGTVVNHAFMGDHVDTYLDVNIAVEHAQRVVVRSALPDVIDRFPIGTVTALALQPRNLTVFPEASSSL